MAGSPLFQIGIVNTDFVNSVKTAVHLALTNSRWASAVERQLLLEQAYLRPMVLNVALFPALSHLFNVIAVRKTAQDYVLLLDNMWDTFVRPDVEGDQWACCRAA